MQKKVVFQRQFLVLWLWYYDNVFFADAVILTVMQSNQGSFKDCNVACSLHPIIMFSSYQLFSHADSPLSKCLALRVVRQADGAVTL